MNKKPIIIVLIFLVMAGCQKIGEYYAGMNMQPKLTREGFKPGLNVYGVVKTGDDLDSLNHFFEVNKVLFIHDSFDTIFINNADISITRYPVEGSEMTYRVENVRDGIYLNETIETAPGDRWLYRCSYDTFEVTADCIIPNLPQLVDAPKIRTDRSIEFTVVSDTSACMYDIYLLNGENYLFEKRVPVKGADSGFNLKPGWDTTVGTNSIYIFAYDKNLEKYYTTSNTFFKPNAFRPSFSTVNGGYGTFGGISSVLVVVK
jgi:hypothetical protein